MSAPPSDLPYGRQWIDDEDEAAVLAQLRSDWLTQGPTVRAFEDALCEITGAKYAVAVSNGTAALHLACLAAGMQPGDAGVTSDVTFVASANAIRYVGATPFLADVDPTTALMTTASIEECVSRAKRAGKRPRVIIPVDFSGAVADLPAAWTIAERERAVVVEDAAHSLGATYESEGTTYRAAQCAHAHMAILSFHPVKHITTGEGGAITTNDEALYRDLCDLRTHGITKDAARLERVEGPWYYEQHLLGLNYRLTDLQCALGVTQAKKLERFVRRRREIASLYDSRLHALADRIRPLGKCAWSRSSYHLYVACLVPREAETLEQVAERRLALFLALRDQRIFPQVHYIPLHRQPDFRRHGLGAGQFDGADAYYAGCISLPMFPRMSDSDVDRVVAALGEALETR